MPSEPLVLRKGAKNAATNRTVGLMGAFAAIEDLQDRCQHDLRMADHYKIRAELVKNHRDATVLERKEAARLMDIANDITKKAKNSEERLAMEITPLYELFTRSELKADATRKQLLVDSAAIDKMLWRNKDFSQPEPRSPWSFDVHREGTFARTVGTVMTFLRTELSWD